MSIIINNLSVKTESAVTTYEKNEENTQANTTEAKFKSGNIGTTYINRGDKLFAYSYPKTIEGDSIEFMFKDTYNNNK